jgi:predicted GIY-YIG superfamily endonuclease
MGLKYGSNQLALGKIRHQYFNARHRFQRNGHPNLLDVARFTKKYNIHHLVYYEIHSDVYEAITREKRIKKWNRQWKINLIEQNNPQWLDFSIRLF